MLISLPPKDEVEYDFDLEVEFGSGPSNEVHYKIIFYVDHTIWRCLMLRRTSILFI